MALKFEATRIESTDTDPYFIDLKYWERSSAEAIMTATGGKPVILKMDVIKDLANDQIVALKTLYETRVPGVRRRTSTTPTTFDYPHTTFKLLGGKGPGNATLYDVVDIHIDSTTVSSNPSLTVNNNFASGSSSSGHEIMISGGNGGSYQVFKRRYNFDTGDIYHYRNPMPTTGRYMCACSDGIAHYFTAVRTYTSPENGTNGIHKIRFDDWTETGSSFSNTLNTAKYDSCAEISEDNVEMIVFGGAAQTTDVSITRRQVEKIHVDDSAASYEGEVLSANSNRSVSGTLQDQIIAVNTTSRNYFKFDGTSYSLYASSVPQSAYNSAGGSDGISSMWIFGGVAGSTALDTIQTLRFDDDAAGTQLSNTLPQTTSLANAEGGY